MKTLEEHFDDLDRMIDTGAAKPAIRDQIAFIWKQVSTLQMEHAALEQAYQELHTGLEERLAKIQERDKQDVRRWFAEKSKSLAESQKRHTLNHQV